MSLKVLVIPSWYPSDEHPTAGVFIQQQVRALRQHADVAVLYVRTGPEAFGTHLSHEDGVAVARAVVETAPLPASASGRVRALPASIRSRLLHYPAVGLAAFEQLCETWGHPDIVHVQALFPAALIARATKRKHGIPYVVTEHSEEYLPSSELRLVKRPGAVPLVLRPLARGASRTIAVSRFLADRLVELGLAVDPVVIPNVVPVVSPAPMPLGAPHAIAHVSIMGPAKNLDGLLRAVDRLRGRRSDFTLRLVGDGQCREELERLSGSLGLGEVVEFTGTMRPEEVQGVFASSAFTVISSTHETFSVVAAESLMSGRPVLSTRCGGPEEYLTSDVGRLIDAGSVDALVEGLDWMLDHFADFDPEALHAYARARFAPDVVAERVMAVYRAVLDA